MSAINFSNITKTFNGKQVLNNLNLTLEPGTITGLLGKNGAGKTTLLNIAMGLLNADHGEAEVFTQSSWDMPSHVKQRIGFVAQTFDHFSFLTAKQLFAYLAGFYKQWNSERVASLLHEWQVEPNVKISTLSIGQQQKLAIIAAMGHRPELLVLDEPVASLDPSARRAFIKELIELNASQQTSILFSTHITSDIERVAADVAILQDGEVFYHGGLDILKERYKVVNVLADKPLPDIFDIDGVLKGLVSGKQAKLIIEDVTAETLVQLEQEFSATVTTDAMSLEDIFVELCQ